MGFKNEEHKKFLYTHKPEVALKFAEEEVKVKKQKEFEKKRMKKNDPGLSGLIDKLQS